MKLADFLGENVELGGKFLAGEDILVTFLGCNLFKFFPDGELAAAPLVDAVLTVDVVFNLVFSWGISSFSCCSCLPLSSSCCFLLDVLLAPMSTTVIIAKVLLAVLVSSCQVLLFLGWLTLLAGDWLTPLLVEGWGWLWGISLHMFLLSLSIKVWLAVD